MVHSLGIIKNFGFIKANSELHYFKNNPMKICVHTVEIHMEGLQSYIKPYMGLNATKPVFGVFDKGRFKPVSSATEKS